MKDWNEKRLSDFFRVNFDKNTCQCRIENEKLMACFNEVRFRVTNFCSDFCHFSIQSVHFLHNY